MPGPGYSGRHAAGMRAGIGFCLSLIVLQLAGCQVSNTWFQMDSNSPMPFFGFDIPLPRRSALRSEERGPASQRLAHAAESPAAAIPVRLRHASKETAERVGEVVPLSFE